MTIRLFIFLVSVGTAGVFCGHLCHFYDLFHHLLLFLVGAGYDSRIETSIKVALHKHLMDGTEHSHDSEVLLHRINAISTLLDHLRNLSDRAFGFLEIYKDLLLPSVITAFHAPIITSGGGKIHK